MSTSDFDNAPAGNSVPVSWDPLSEMTHVTIVEGCGCACCIDMRASETDGVTTKGGFNEANPATPIGTLLPLYTNPDGSRSITGDRNVDAALIGSKWGTQNLTFSFPTTGTNYNGTGFDANGVSLYHLDLGTLQQQAARAAFAQISAWTNLTFTEITETDTVHANIRISQSGDNDVASAYGGFPSDTRGVAGDIWFGRTNQPFYDLAVQGTWGFSTMFHEIGHTMGLKHGHQDYTNSNLSSFFGTSPRFGTQSLTADRDGQAWSLMTYTPAPFTNGNFAGEKVNQPQSYMQYDLAALQYMYGANYTTNAGDSVYTFSATTGEMFINGVGQGAPSGNKILMTIWDGGGNDTIDASNYSGGVTIDLRPGEFSTVDQAQLANHLAYQNLTALAPGNIAMSLLYNNDARSLIENATGGVGNDIFVGNIANNRLDGGAGSDTVIFTNVTGINVTLKDDGTDVIVTHDGETDTLRSIENIGGTVGNDTITGNSQDNILTGGSGGADVLSGGAGNDRLIGGGFTTSTTFSAPSQADITKASSTNNGSIATAIDTAGAYDVDSNPNIVNSTSIPHATINATAFGGTLEYYRIDVATAGTQAVFDIDGNGTLNDSILELINSAGTVLANNDTGPGDTGTTTGDDAYISYTFTTPGTYYIRVGQFISNSIAQPMTAGQTYQLHISLQGAAAVTTTVTANTTSSAILDGGSGNDFLQGTISSDTLTGGTGTDTASFVNAFSGGSTTGVTVDLNVQGVAQNTVAAGSDTLSGIENLIGSALNDTLTGDANDNVIEGGLGNDVLGGGAGNDTASYAGATAGVTVSLASQGVAQNTVNAGSDTLSGFENLLGSAFADSLSGDANANVVTGGAGDDTLDPGANTAGNVDVLDGGAGSDTASFASLTGVTAVLNGAADGAASVGGVAVATLRGIENLQGGAGNDTLTGDANANVIEGGLGDDVLDGGAGVDTLSFRGSTAVTVNLATLTAQATGFGNDTITNFENVRTGSGADNITGDANDNVFFDGGGNDVYNGAGGIDTVDYSGATSTVSVNLNTLVAQNTGTSGGSDTITNVENVIGAAGFANVLQGNTAGNRLVGGALADTLTGNNGADTLEGGAGNDVLLAGSNGALDDGSSDIVYGGAGNDFIAGGQGNDFLYGGDGDDNLVGGIGNTASQAFSNDGGQDTFDGGDGNDIAQAFYTDQTGGIAFDLANVAGNSLITMGGVAAGSFTSIERIIFRGGLGNDVVKGSGTLDTLVGNAGDDVLDGWFGNDSLSGGLGNDTLIGGEGLDTATYVNSTAGVNVDLRIQGVAQDTGGEGIDTLSGIEYLTGSGFGDTLRGDDDFNLIIDNLVSGVAGQTDSLFGYGGNDSILVTRVTAAPSTNINLDGGAGDDLIELRGGTASAALAALGSGLSSTTYLAAGATSNDRNVDVVTVDGGAGNDRIILTGVSSATINAGSGADFISISLRGAANVNNYQLTLGTGADIVQFGVGATAALSADVAITARSNRVTDFEIGNLGDKFEMSNFLNLGLTGYTANSNAFASGHLRLVQGATDLLLQVDRDGTGATNGFVTVFAITNGYTGGFTAYNFDGFIGDLVLSGFAIDETITGATGNDTLSGNDGNDVLIGLSGNDTLDGGNGNDLLLGGSGNDTLIGGAGNDTASFSDATSGVTVNLNIVGGQTTGAGVDSLTGIENLTGSAFNDSLTGDANANVLIGGAGDDLLDGRGGDDTLIGGTGNDLFVVDAAGDVVTELAGEGSDTVSSSVDYTLTANVENLLLTGAAVSGTGNDLDNVILGNDLNNLLDGGAGNDSLNGGIGNDSLFGGAGDDTLFGGVGNDAMTGGAGNDLFLVDAAGDTASELAGEGNDTVSSSVDFTLGANLENLLLTGSAISGTGNALNNVIMGNANANILDGGAGDDTLDGGAGDDLLRGGAGNDTITGGAGTDTVSFSDATASVTVNLSIDGGQTTGAGADAITGVENLTGSAFNDSLTGDAAANLIIGGSGDDLLDGRAGSDAMIGGTGNDEFVVDEAGDVVTEGAGEGSDTVSTSIDYRLGANLENLLLTGAALLGTGNELDNVILGNLFDNILDGGEGNDSLNGGAGNDTLVGGAGDDTLFGGVGADAMTGGAGNDLYVVDDAGDTVGENAGEGSDTVSSSVSYTLGANIEALLLTGSALSGTGNTLDNVIIGNAGANILDGVSGNDVMNGGAGDDFYFVNSTGDTVGENAGEGSDTVSSSIDYILGANIENLVLTGEAVRGTGNGLDNLLKGNALGNALLGGAGNDRLIGGDGVDFLTGGTGNDSFVAEINATKTMGRTGAISLDVVLDFQTGDKIDVSGLGAFNFKGVSANENAGDLTYKVYASVDGAESALGYDIDGVSGPSSYSGPVTMVFGNTDGGAADFAIALIGVGGVSSSDFTYAA